MTTIAIKDFRNNLSSFADKAEKGESFIVFRRSKPAFKVVPVEIETDEKWETVIDFTQKGKKSGEKIEDVISVLENMK